LPSFTPSFTLFGNSTGIFTSFTPSFTPSFTLYGNFTGIVPALPPALPSREKFSKTEFEILEVVIFDRNESPHSRKILADGSAEI